MGETAGTPLQRALEMLRKERRENLMRVQELNLVSDMPALLGGKPVWIESIDYSTGLVRVRETKRRVKGAPVLDSVPATKLTLPTIH